MAEILEKMESGHLTYSPGGTSTTNTVIFATSLILMLSTVAIFFSSAVYSLALSWKVRLEGRPPLPPGSLGMPFVGENRPFVANRLTFLQSRHAKYGPIFKSSVLYNTVFLQPPVSNKFLFVNENKLLRMCWLPSMTQLLGKDSMSVKIGDDFKLSRRHFNPLFSRAAVEKYMPQIERKVVRHLAESWQPSSAAKTGSGQENEFEVAVWHSGNKLAFQIIVDLVLSLDPDDIDLEELRGLFWVWIRGLGAMPIYVPGTLYYQAMKARRRILGIFEILTAKRRVELEEGRATPSQDFLSYFLTNPDAKGELMSNEEIKDNLLMLVNAGHSTISSAMALTLRFISLHPNVYDLMKKEHDLIAEQKALGECLTKDDLANMKYTWCVIQESMRILPPTRGGFREMTKDVELEGFTIPKGWKMYWNTIAHMDPKFFEEPETFDPARFDGKKDILPYTYTPFGGGVRMCPGNEFAKTELLIHMHYVIRNYTFTLVHPDEPVAYTPLPSQKSGTLMRIRKSC